MTAVRTGKDIYKGCEPKPLFAAEVIVVAAILIVIIGIIMIASPSVTDDTFDNGVVESRKETTTPTFLRKGLDR